VLIPLPVGRLDMMLRALGTSKEKASRDSYQADIHKDILKKLTRDMKCLIVSSCLLVLNVALMNILLGMSRVALENHSKGVAFL